MSILTKLQALLAAANEKVERTYTNLTDAIAELIDGYHSGITPTGTISITQNGTGIDVAQYAAADVNVSGGVIPAKGFVPTAWNSAGEITDGVIYGFSTLPNYMFNRGQSTVTSSLYNLVGVTLPDGVTEIPSYFAQGNANLALDELPPLSTIFTSAFYGCSSLRISELKSQGSASLSIDQRAFYKCTGIQSLRLKGKIGTIYSYAFQDCTGLAVVRFDISNVASIQKNAFNGCTNLLDIYVPWSEGDVTGAPWGATNATMHYGYVPPET